MNQQIDLIKLSEPGWIKTYTNEIDLRAELYKHICSYCREGELDDRLVLSDAVNENSSIDDMLSTSCGCEYLVEEIKKHFGVEE